ncbi:type II toxin-antitoxin system PemK/MazF family toxin [Butyrivibrio proteoclasticus]|uniref:type II toxin-antitoxin system PemK/MazF family toxin n=1 Tax=Butyrivibrio proteoclasticus TaxID=43305 RepID=UPI0009DDD707|nr:type II toxin-antitoxin system PemK/MazF family toxin [Butyrivibrio proteoclasticus]
MCDLNSFHQYDIVWIKNPVTDDEETHRMRGDHYGIVLSEDIQNVTSGTCICCYLTSNLSRLDIKSNIVLQFYEGLKSPSVAKIATLVQLDTSCIVSKVGHLTDADAQRIRDGLCYTFSIK